MGCTTSQMRSTSVASLLPNNISEFELSPVIDIGRKHSLVHVAKFKDDEQYYALKIYSKHQMLKHKENLKDLQQQLKMLSILQHKSHFICNIVEAFQDSHHCYLLTELCIGSSIYFNLSIDGRCNEIQAIFVVSQLLIALDCCHSMNILHRNVNTKSILIAGDGYVKLSGFDRAILRSDINHEIVETEVRARECIYLAPEILSAHSYGVSSDWFSVGVTLFEMITYNDKEDEKPGEFKAPFLYSFLSPHGTIDLTFLESLPFVSTECKLFIKQLMCPRSHERLGSEGGLEEIKNHAWLRNFNWKSVRTKTTISPIPVNADYLKVDLTQPEQQSAIKTYSAKVDVSEADQVLFRDYSLNERSYCRALEIHNLVDERKSDLSRHHHRRRQIADRDQEVDSDGMRWTHAYDLKSSYQPYNLANEVSCIGSPTGRDPLCGSLSSYYLQTHLRENEDGYRTVEDRVAHEERTFIPLTTCEKKKEKKVEKLSIDVSRVDDDEYLALRAAVPEIRRGKDRNQYIRSFTPPIESEATEDDDDYDRDNFQASMQTTINEPLSSPSKGEGKNDSMANFSLRLSDETKMAEHVKSMPGVGSNIGK